MTTIFPNAAGQAPQRIGIIVPSANRQVEQEMIPRLPAGFVAHVTRLRMVGANYTPLAQLLPRAADSAAALSDAGVTVVAFNCTASSMEEGVAGNRALEAALREATQGAVTTTASAVQDAARAVKATRVVLVTPYSAAVTARAAAFLEECGIEVLRSVARDVAGNGPYYDIPAKQWLAELIDARDARANGYVLSCANIAALDVIGAAEAALGAPVLTSNQALMWRALRMAGCAQPLAGLGTLGTA